MKRKAFTLIELAIAITIIGIMIGGSFQAVKAMREKGRITEAKEQVKASKDTILGYVARWPNLPSGAEFQNDLSPIKSNQHAIFYASDTALSTINNDVCAYSTTALKVVDNGVIPPRTIDNVAFVVAHEGANYNMQTALNANIVNIYAPSTRIDDNTTPVNIVDFYDDIVEWVTLDELQHNVRCSDKPLRIINNYLPTGIVGTSYSANIFVDGNYSAPTSHNCAPNSFNGLTYSNYTISGTPASSGTFRIDCSVSADGRDTSRAFAITIDPLADSNGTGGLPFGSLCSSNSECAAGLNCTGPNPKTCK